MASVIREGEVIVVTNDPDFSTKVMDKTIGMWWSPMGMDVLRRLMANGSKSFIFQFAPSASPEMVHGSVLTNNGVMLKIFHGLD